VVVALVVGGEGGACVVHHSLNLTHGCVMCMSQSGKSALLVATTFGHVPVIRCLLDQGANVDLQDKVRREGRCGGVSGVLCAMTG